MTQVEEQTPVVELHGAVKPKPSGLRLVKTIAWAFIGLRKRSEFEQDIKLNPLHIVAAGLIGALLFVLALVALVHWVV